MDKWIKNNTAQAHCTRCQYFIVGDGSYGQRNACTANDFYDTKVIEGVEIQTMDLMTANMR